MKKILLSFLIIITFISGASFVNAETEEETIARLLQQIVILQQLIAQAIANQGNAVNTPAATCSPIITQNLSRGSTGDEVLNLNIFLEKEGYLNINPDDGFGLFTEIALQRYQSARGVVSSGSPNTTGYGLVGPKTRAAINEDVCQKNNPSNASGDVDVDIDLNDDEFEPGDVIEVTGTIENNTNRAISYNSCDAFTVEVDGVDESRGYDFCYSNQETIDPGEKKEFKEDFIIANYFDDEGEYTVVATFPGGYEDKEDITINVESDDSDDDSDNDNDDDSDSGDGGEITTSISLNDDDYSAGDTIVITALLENTTDEEMDIDDSDCAITVDINGVAEEILNNNCELDSSSSGGFSYFYYGDDGIEVDEEFSWVYRYKIPSSFSGSGNYEVEVVFPDGSKKTETIYIGPTDPDYQITYNLNKSRFNSRETIIVSAVLKNISDEDIRLTGRRYNQGCGYLALSLAGIAENNTTNCGTSTYNIETLSPNESITLSNTFRLPKYTYNNNKTRTLTIQFPGGEVRYQNIVLRRNN